MTSGASPLSVGNGGGGRPLNSVVTFAEDQPALESVALPTEPEADHSAGAATTTGLIGAGQVSRPTKVFPIRLQFSSEKSIGQEKKGLDETS